MMDRGSSQVTFTDGTHRTVDPNTTFQRIEPLFDRIGITRIADITGLDKIGVPVCNAIRPNGRSLSVSQGKGIALPQARVSAAMETIELFHAETIDAETYRTSYERLLLEGEPAIDPFHLPLLSEDDYQAENDINWLLGHDLMSDKATWVPFDVVSCDMVPEALEDTVFMLSSNGLASGNHMLEAISHGICEVVERDGTALHDAMTKGLIHEPNLIDVDSVDNASCRFLLDQLIAAEVQPYIWWQTSDINLPSFGCAITETSQSSLWADLGTFHGFGCHVSKSIALSRAITEAIQSRLTYISGARDDLFREDFALMQSERHNARWSAYLGAAAAVCDFRDFPDHESTDLRADIEFQLDALDRAGFGQVVVTNLTKPVFELPVVRVTIPGLIEDIDRVVPSITKRVHEYRAKSLAMRDLMMGPLRQAAVGKQS